MTSHAAARRVSIIICNYNYKCYVGEAIQSALDARWPNKEVIVIDDGSTDGSWDVIRSFEGRGIVAMRQENGGQVVALERGFAGSTGELVVFLDSDDLLEPDMIEEAEKAFRPGTSKVQVRMKVIDADGRRGGEDYPRFPAGISPEKIRRWVEETSAYPTPPGTGNMYSRWFLDRILPAVAPRDRAFDSYCLALAPHLGDVETIDMPLVSYRVHGKNIAAMKSLVPEKFQTEIQRAVWRTEYARKYCAAAGLKGPADPLTRSIPVLMMRASSLRLRPGIHPIPHDSRWRIALDFAKALRLESQFAPWMAAALFAWTLGILAAPKPLAERLVSWRFAPATRPATLRKMLAR